ncbi:MAG: hypothetical protein ACOYNL_03320 [Rickettsiales bacterium]
MTVHPIPAATADVGAPVENTRTTRLQRAMDEVMKVSEGPELLSKLANREFRDAFQAIAVQQRGYMLSETTDLAAIPMVQMNFDPDHPEDKSKQLYECKIGSAVLTAETAKALRAAAAARNIRFSHKGEFTNDHWFKATIITIHDRDLGAIVKLINDELIEKIRPDARVTFEGHLYKLAA